VRTAATVALRAVPRAALALPPAWRRRVAAALAALLALAALYLVWFRNSSFVRVDQVDISGLSGPQSKSIRTALVDAGLGMTTLHVRDAALRDAVSAFPVVRSVSATGDFPHGLRIQVELNLPIAVLHTAAGRTPVADDGLLLPDVPVTPGLPTLNAGGTPPTKRVSAGRAFALLHVASLAPAPLRPRIRDIGFGANGIVAHLRRGPYLIFGSADRLDAKWLAAARVLASPSARGATYIDLRLPDRPAAGGLSTTSLVPLAPAGPAAGTTPSTGTSTATSTSPATATTPTTTTQATATQTTTATTTTPATTTGPSSAATGPATTPSTTTQTPAAATTGGAQQAPP
jgi:cell division protein FtsQ